MVPSFAKKSRLLELDVFRGFAALSVMLYHYTDQFNRLYGHTGPVPDLSFGYYRLHLFFILSGFVTVLLLERTRTSMDFIVSRFSRLFPTYWASITITFLVVSMFSLPGREVGLGQYLFNFTMLAGFVDSIEYVDGAHWTLTLELKFYFFMFLFFMLGWVQKRMELVTFLWVLYSVLAHMSRTMLDTDIVHNYLWTMANFGFIQVIAVGMMFYRIYKHGPTSERYLIIMLALVTHYVYHGINEAMVVTGLAFVFFLFNQGYLRWICVRPLLFLGNISYALFLVHESVGYVIMRNLEANGVNATLALSVAVCNALVLATILHYAVEKPSLNGIRIAYKSLKEFRPLRFAREGVQS